MCTDILSYIHIYFSYIFTLYIHSFIYLFLHTYIHSFTHIFNYTRTPYTYMHTSQLHTYNHTYLHINKQTYIPTYIHTYINRTSTLLELHSLKYTRIHAYIHTYIHYSTVKYAHEMSGHHRHHWVCVSLRRAAIPHGEGRGHTHGQRLGHRPDAPNILYMLQLDSTAWRGMSSLYVCMYLYTVL